MNEFLPCDNDAYVPLLGHVPIPRLGKVKKINCSLLVRSIFYFHIFVR